MYTRINVQGEQTKVHNERMRPDRDDYVTGILEERLIEFRLVYDDCWDDIYESPRDGCARMRGPLEKQPRVSFSNPRQMHFRAEDDVQEIYKAFDDLMNSLPINHFNIFYANNLNYFINAMSPSGVHDSLIMPGYSDNGREVGDKITALKNWAGHPMVLLPILKSQLESAVDNPKMLEGIQALFNKLSELLVGKLVAYLTKHDSNYEQRKEYFKELTDLIDFIFNLNIPGLQCSDSSTIINTYLEQIRNNRLLMGQNTVSAVKCLREMEYIDSDELFELLKFGGSNLHMARSFPTDDPYGRAAFVSAFRGVKLWYGEFLSDEQLRILTRIYLESIKARDASKL